MPRMEVGEVIRGRYVLKSCLGAGRNGVVFRAQDRLRAALPEDQQHVALKTSRVSADNAKQAFENLRAEFHLTQRLAHHNVVKVYELDREGDVAFFTMELIDGEPLSGILEHLRPAGMNRAHAWPLIRQLCEGVAHLHERGLVHGDLNPQNVFVTRRGEIRIVDFDSAHSAAALDHHPDRGGQPAFGSPAYASCEQLEGRGADPRDDLYALACICYELLAGRHPFGSRPANRARDYQVSLIRPGGLKGRQWRALRQGLSWHRARRSISVKEWMDELTGQRSGNDSPAPLNDIMAPRTEPAPVWRAAAACLAVLAGAAILIQLRPQQASTAVAPSPPSGPELSDLPATNAEEVAVPNAPRSKEDVPAPAAATRPARPVPALLSVEPSQVTTDDHFVEIRLHRSVLQKNGSFSWWTEPATAKAGVDYESTSVPAQPFPAGFHMTRVYVRLLPKPLRSQRSYFYVVIAKRDANQKLATVIRKQVWLPTSLDLQARR